MEKIDAIILSSTFKDELIYLEEFLDHCCEMSTIINKNYSVKPLIVFEKSESEKAKYLIEIFKTKCGLKPLILINDEGIGFSSCLNYGIKNSVSKYIIRLDTDDRLLARRLVDQLNLMESKNLDISSGYMMNQNNKVLKYPKNNFSLIISTMLGTNPIAHPSICINRKVLYLEYSENLTRAEDFELWLRLFLSRDLNWECIGEPITKYNDSNSFKKDKENALFQIKIRIKYSLKYFFIIVILIIGIFPNILRIIFKKNIFLAIRRLI